MHAYNGKEGRHLVSIVINGLKFCAGELSGGQEESRQPGRFGVEEMRDRARRDETEKARPIVARHCQ